MPSIRIITIAASICAVSFALIYIFQSRFVYYPIRILSSDPSSIGIRFEDVRFETADGVQLSGWFIPCNDARGVVLFCHGNAGNISHRLDSIAIFHRLGLDVFIFDYRGYGESEGKPTEYGTYEDAEAAWQYLIEEREVNPKQVVVFGRSIGGALAAWLAQHHKPGALILESTFTSLRDAAATIYHFPPIRWFVRFEYNTAEHLAEVNCPVLVVHSRDDEIMSFHHGQRLFELAGEPKMFLEITGTHNEGFITSGRHYEEGLDAFISECAELEP
jgi:alpha-beta hydrolase superfamily lysophospholipase